MSKQIRQQIENYQRDLQILQRKYDTSKGKLDLIKSNLEKNLELVQKKKQKYYLKKRKKNYQSKINYFKK